MKYNFDEKVDRRGTWSMKWDCPDFFRQIAPDARLDEDTIPLQIADMDFACAPAISEALARTARFPSFGYVHLDACKEYMESIIHWNQRRHQWTPKKEDILYCGSALEAVRIAIAAFTEPGDGVIVNMPVYSFFMKVISEQKRTVVNCPLTNKDGYYAMDWEGFEACCSKRENKLFVLCSPDNPVGRVWTPEELVRMAEICRQNGVILVSDEIHSDFVWKGYRHTPILKAVTDQSNLILVSGPNKTFNLMGLECAYTVITDAALRERYCLTQSLDGPTAFTFAATIAAYEHSEDWLNELLAYLEESLDFIVDFLHTNLPEVKVQKPEGTYIVWADFSGLGFTAEELMERINHKGNVFLQSGHGCDPQNGQLYMRICATSPRPVLEEAMRRIYRAVKE